MSNSDDLKKIIENFSINKFINFFRTKTNFCYQNVNKDEFKEIEEKNKKNKFTNSVNIGYIDYQQEKVLVCAFKVNKQLTEKSAKKDQYDIAIEILKKYEYDYQAGIFVFYDINGNFRFSLVYPQYHDKKREFSNFRRFTYFVSKDFTNKTFLSQIGEKDFTTYNDLKEAFSVEKVSKEFYKKLQDWYFWAVKNVSFPNDISTTEDNQKYNNENVIRLITRVIFVWFLKHKDLIPNSLFDKEYLKENVLKDFEPLSKTQNNYYRAILQNLFFATLNKQINERAFALDTGTREGNKDTYNIKTLYRYEKEFKISQKEIIELYSTIPFLNGGLFECLDDKEKIDKKTGKKTIYYWDGFSRRKERQANIPNFLFFAQEQTADLSKEYNDKKFKKVQVSGLINILQQFNFTIDENSPDDAEIALDPELLGKVFENLLGAYNPETQETARKESGSFYTPREIVNYMVNESLTNYLLQKIPQLESIQEDLRVLINTQQEIPDSINHNKQLKENIINNLFECKILDPACGSGAFPVGILQQMVHILRKLDLKNEYWYKKVLENLNSKFKTTKNSLTKEEFEQEKEDIDNNFNSNINNPDYARKLYLIENCIYGVDIQSIAIQISRLRLFISLICEQDIKKDNKDNNYNIRPLPNLESNFVCANTLVGLQQKEGKKIEFFDTNIIQQNTVIEQLIHELKDNRHKLFSVVSYEKKKNLINKEQEIKKELKLKIADVCKKEQDEKLIRLNKYLETKKIQLAKIEKEPEKIETIEETNLFGEKTVRQLNLFAEEKRNLSSEIRKIENDIRQIKELDIKQEIKMAETLIDWNPYDQNTSSEFFEPSWMFGFYRENKGGFDIVIANPPYIQLQKMDDAITSIYEKQNFQTYNKMGDIYCLFYDKGVELLVKNGILCYITSNKWMRAGYGEAIREFFTNNTNPIKLIDLGPNVFECATVDTNILFLTKTSYKKNTMSCTMKDHSKSLIEYVREKAISICFDKSAWAILTPIEKSIKEKIEKYGTPLKDWDISINYGIKTGCNEAFIIDGETKDRLIKEDPKSAEIIRPILRGRDIQRYNYTFDDKWLIYIPWHFPLHLDNSIQGSSKKAEKQLQEKYPAIYKHLLKHKKNLMGRNKEEVCIRYEWYALQRWGANYWEDFFKQKIVWGNISYNSSFCMAEEGMFINAPANLLTSNTINLSYLLAVLNSKIFNWEFKQIGIFLGNAFEWKKQYVEQIHIPNYPKKEVIQEITNLQRNININEDKIENIICKLYKLSDEEINFIKILNI